MTILLIYVLTVVKRVVMPLLRRQSGTAPGSQAATAPPELHDDLVGEDFSCLKYSGNSGNPIIRAETLLYPPRRLQGTTPWTRAAIRG